MVSTSSPQSRKLAQTCSKYVKVIYLIVDQCIFNHCLQRQSHDQSWYIKILPNYRILYHLFLLQLYFKSFLTSRPKKIQQNTIEIHRCLHIASRKFTTTYSHSALTARPLYQALLPIRMFEIELYLAVGDLGSRLDSRFKITGDMTKSGCFYFGFVLLCVNGKNNPVIKRFGFITNPEQFPVV